MRVDEFAHVHQPRRAATKRAAAQANGKSGAGRAGPEYSRRSSSENGGAWAMRSADTSANRSLSHFCWESVSFRVWRHAAHSWVCATISVVSESPAVCAISDWILWQFMT